MACNPVFHAITKHIELDVHFVRSLVADQKLEVRYVPTESQRADLLTKALPLAQFQHLCNKFAMVVPMSSLWGPVEDVDIVQTNKVHSYQESSPVSIDIYTTNSYGLHVLEETNLCNKLLLDSSTVCLNTDPSSIKF